MTDQVLSLQKSDLIQPVRKLLNSETANILTWEVKSLGGSFIDSGNIFKVSGQAIDNDNPVEWVMVLKIIQSPVNRGVPLWMGGDFDHALYWRREANLFESDFLKTVPNQFVVPECYGIVEKSTDLAFPTTRGEWEVTTDPTTAAACTAPTTPPSAT